MPRTQTATVEVRQLAPELAEPETPEQLLYRPVPQLAGPPTDWKVKYEWVTPERADDLLRRSSGDPEFRQRAARTSDVRRWRNLMSRQGFVNFFPGGTVCIDPDGIMLNGMHRMMAVAGQEEPRGFMVVYNVPRWMFSYFDTNRVRTIKDVFHIGARATGPQTASAMRLAMRYEEFIMGLRPGTGWRHWNTQKDEHQDVDGFLARRGELQDWYGVGEKVYRYTKMLIPSVMVFRFYQGLAWPDGDTPLTEFCESLVTGSMLSPQSPVLVLREWAKDCFYEKTQIFAKRELHTMLLFRTFQQHVQASRITKLNLAYGIPMTMPYHPKGHEVAIENIKKALAELDSA